MSNATYCQFRNTLADLQSCSEDIFDPSENSAEESARLRLIDLCTTISEEFLTLTK